MVGPNPRIFADFLPARTWYGFLVNRTSFTTIPHLLHAGHCTSSTASDVEDMDATQKNATAWVTRLMSTIGRQTDNLPASVVNVFVYRVGSVRSSQRSTRNQFFGGRRGYGDRSGLTFKQWLLVMFEMCLSFVWWVILERRKQFDDLNRKGFTERQILIDFYLRQACGSFVSLLVGYLADTYFNMYAMAIFNVILHFVMSTMLFVEIMIRLGDYNLYQEFFFQSVGILLIPLKATDFTRLVYGLQNVGRSNFRTSLLFIFISVWLNERSVRGLVVTVASRFYLPWESNVQLSFVLSGATLAVYLYVFKPPVDEFEVNHGPVGNNFIGCVVTAVWTRQRYKTQLSENVGNWLDYAEIKYEKSTINRTRDLLKLYFLLLPTIGFSLFATPRSDLYKGLFDRFVPSGVFVATGILDGAAIITMLSMGVMQFVLLPLVEWIGLKKVFLPRFIVGYICALLCIWYATGILQSLEDAMPTPTVGMVRVFNARDDPVRLVSQDRSITSFDRVAQPRQEVTLAVRIRGETLVPVRFTFTETNITTYLSAHPDIMIGYLSLEPAAVVRMGKKLPVRDLPAGKNDPKLPKVYVFNALSTKVTVEFSAPHLEKHFQFKVFNNILTVAQIPEATYSLRTLEFESSGAKRIKLAAGGFYGVIAHESSLETLLTTDTLVVSRRLDSVYMLGVFIPYGFAIVLTFVTLRCTIFFNTPDGMEGLSFGFLEFLDNVTYLVFWFGHVTWHPYIMSYSLWIYSIIELLLMFSCIFVFIRYGDWYQFH